MRHGDLIPVRGHAGVGNYSKKLHLQVLVQQDRLLSACPYQPICLQTHSILAAPLQQEHFLCAQMATQGEV